MSGSQLRELRSIDELRAVAEPWDDLWQRSDLRLPTMQCDMLAQWLEQFAPRSRLRILIVEQDGRLVAALPLVQARFRGLVNAGSAPGNPWSVAGDLALDTGGDLDGALDALAGGLDAAGWPLLCFETINPESRRWSRFEQALTRRGLACVVRKRFEIGRVAVEGTWEKYQAFWSRNHRRAIKRALAKAEGDGTVELAVYDRPRPDEIERLLREGFGVEDRSWKGREGSSVMRTPGMLEFFIGQGRLLAARNQLQLVLLRHNGSPIAFEYGWSSKGTYFSPKVGFDEAFHQYAPGQLLRARLFERFFREKSHEEVDFLGPIVDATAKWSTSSYPIASMIVAPRRLKSRLLLGGYRTLSDWKEKVKKWKAARAARAKPAEGATADTED